MNNYKHKYRKYRKKYSNLIREYDINYRDDKYINPKIVALLLKLTKESIHNYFNK